MAKNQKGPVEQVRAKKAKSATQIARKAENEANAKMRCSIPRCRDSPPS